VTDRIATGGMGVVWLARDERLQRPVAIKQLVLQPGLPAEEADDMRQRALREARIAARLQHPNAIVVFDVFEHEAQPCLVMEYLPSRSLAAVVTERGPLPFGEVAAIGRQVAGALAAAHAAQILHRDIKPGNVLVTDSGVAKIGDFSVSRAPGDVTITPTGVLAGTPAFMAPEAARGQQATPAADVFSLGATLYAAVEGHGPFGSEDNQLAMLHTAAAGRVQPPRRAGPLGGVLEWALAPDPAARPDMTQFHAALTEILGAPAAPAMPSPVHPSPPRIDPHSGTAAPPSAAAPGELRRRLASASDGVLVAAAAAVLALGGIAAAAAVGQASGEQPSAASGRAAGKPAPAPEPAGPVPLDPTTASEPATPEPTPEPEPTPQPEPTPDANQESEPDPEPSPETSRSPTRHAVPADFEEPIEWSAAGELVIDYYAGAADPSGAWYMLTPGAQRAFGSRSEFREYWNQYQQVWAQDAYGVTVNQDGSVNVPVDVIYITGDSRYREHKVLRVTRLDGQLLITTEAR
jgi:serine/threonine protein kinase